MFDYVLTVEVLNCLDNRRLGALRVGEVQREDEDVSGALGLALLRQLLELLLPPRHEGEILVSYVGEMLGGGCANSRAGASYQNNLILHFSSSLLIEFAVFPGIQCLSDIMTTLGHGQKIVTGR